MSRSVLILAFPQAIFSMAILSPRFDRRSVDEGIVPRQIVFTTKAAKPPATYSQAVKAAGLVFVSGAAPIDPATGGIARPTIQEQTSDGGR